MSAGPCQYTFDPEEWEREHGRPAEFDGEWSCPREAEGETGYCRYHLSPDRCEAIGIDDGALCDSLLDELAADEEQSLRFVGAEFGTVDFSYEVLDRVTNRPIDLRYVTVHGDLLGQQAVIRQPLSMDGIRVEGAVDFSDAELGEDVSIRQSTFEGRVTFDGADFEDDCQFTGSTFEGRVTFDQVRFAEMGDFYHTRFRAACSFEESEWRGICRFQQAAFRSDLSFVSSRFHSRVNFRTGYFTGLSRFNRCVFDDVAVFIDCEFEAEALFKKVRFGAPAHYQCADFDSEASFTEATFEDKAKFHFAAFHGEAVLSYIDFADATYFKAADFNSYASFYESTFERLTDFRKVLFTDTVRFMKAEFDGSTFFDRATFVGDGDFRNAAFRANTRFVESEFQSSATMQETVFDDVSFSDVETSDGDVTINLERASIEAGRFVQRDSEDIYYNVRDSRIGDVDIEMPESEQVFERFFIYRTEFDGFDFSNYRYVLAPGWVLHTFGGTVDDTYDLEAERFSVKSDTDDTPAGGGAAGEAADAQSSGSPDTASLSSWLLTRVVNPEAPDLEVTYLKAKNGAERVGDSQSASRFFIKEMSYRRQTHLDRVFNHQESLRSRAKLLFLVIVNLTLSATCGYGEKPRRTLGFSVVTIGAYAALFSLFVPAPPFGLSLGYILLSVQSFTSLIFGSSAAVPGFVGSFLAASEGFVGAFMIGLFIFALTRSVHR